MGIRGRVRWVSKGNHSHRTGYRAVNALSPPRPRTRFARPRFALSRSDWAIHFPTQTPVGWFHARSLHLIRTIGSATQYGSTVYIVSGSRYALGPYTPVDPSYLCLTDGESPAATGSSRD